MDERIDQSRRRFLGATAMTLAVAPFGAWCGPALYFLDERGRVRGQHFGEGEYESSERRIQRMLADAGAPAREESLAPVPGTGIELPADWASLESPETYTGYARTQNFASPGGAAAGAGSVVEPRLYQLVRQSGPIVDRQFEIEFLDAGVDAFAFTFG
jgi:hypothetical protein